MSTPTVSRARKATVTGVTVAKRIGKDGKARKMPAAKPAKVEAFSADEFDAEDGITVDMVEQANAASRRRYFMKCAADVQRKGLQGAEVRDARAAEAAAIGAQADALDIEAQAKRRLADEYDAAQARGEVRRRGHGDNREIPGKKFKPTAADVGLSAKKSAKLAASATPTRPRRRSEEPPRS